jgi:hypothetical protein
MRSMGLLLGTLAAGSGTSVRRSVESEDKATPWTSDRAAAWRAWRVAGERNLMDRSRARRRAHRAPRIAMSRPYRAGPWLPLVLNRTGAGSA